MISLIDLYSRASSTHELHGNFEALRIRRVSAMLHDIRRGPFAFDG